MTPKLVNIYTGEPIDEEKEDEIPELIDIEISKITDGDTADLINIETGEIICDDSCLIAQPRGGRSGFGGSGGSSFRSSSPRISGGGGGSSLGLLLQE